MGRGQVGADFIPPYPGANESLAGDVLGIGFAAGEPEGEAIDVRCVFLVQFMKAHPIDNIHSERICYSGYRSKRQGCKLQGCKRVSIWVNRM
jgi:hypothetical protein